MTTDDIKCPCCGQATTPTQKAVADYEENVFRYQGHSVKMTRRILNLAGILAKRMPETVPAGLIVEKMWPNDEGEYAETNVKVGITQLRKIVRPLGLDVLNTWGIGYRMVEVSRTERPFGFYTVTGAHRAQA